ncbi:MAG TPA: GNAT family N-acetyltransferase, partial [Archangium sp.]
TRFESWAAYEAFVKASPVPRTGDNARQRRRLEKELGPLRFELDDARPEAFDACIRWKSSQYLATGLQDMFADPRNVALFRRLRERGVLQVNSLSAGDKLLAVHFASWHDRRTTWWVPAYDPEWSKFSPGRILLEDLMKASFERKDREFDFLIGAEGYKFMYATHNRVIGEVGMPPLKDLFVKKARREAKAVLEKYPKALELARTMQKRLREFTS